MCISIIQFQPFQENLNVYLGLEQFISLNGNNIATLDVRGENECRRLHCTLRDLSSLLQAMGRLADHFIGDKYERNVADAKMLMERWGISDLLWWFHSNLFIVRVTNILYSFVKCFCVLNMLIS